MRRRFSADPEYTPDPVEADLIRVGEADQGKSGRLRILGKSGRRPDDCRRISGDFQAFRT